jgi:hypothetical protein
MKKIKHHIIEVPLEFKVACTVYRLNIQQVLQIFVDYASIYDSLTGEYSEGFSEATRTISSYARSKIRKTKRSKAFLKCRDTAITCLNGIFKHARMQKGKDVYVSLLLSTKLWKGHIPLQIQFISTRIPR